MIGVKELKEIAIKCGTPSYIFDTDVLCESIRCRKFLAVELQYVMQ